MTSTTPAFTLGCALIISACASSAAPVPPSGEMPVTPSTQIVDSTQTASGKRMAALNYAGPESHVKSFSIPDNRVARSGSIRLKQGSGGILDSAVSLARALGGWAEVRRENWVLLKVPAVSFDRAMNGLMRLGDVRHYSQQADNIREEYEGVEAQLWAGDSALAHAQTEAENVVGEKAKARLLRRIKQQRLELNSLEKHRQTLRARLDSARITVRVAK